VTRLPGLAELVEEGRTGWVVPAGDAAALASVLDREVSRSAAIRMRADVERARAAWSFDTYAEVVLRVARLR
jgi:glycosyltransferase involved in cell wall biosynthesis